MRSSFLRCRCFGSWLNVYARVLLLGGLLGSAKSQGSIEFRRVTSEALTLVGPAPIAAAWGDYDGDGRPDLALADLDRGVRLLRNTANGLQNTSVLLDGGTTIPASGVAWVDYDNDSDLDLFVAAFLGNGHELYRNRGDGTFARLPRGWDLFTPSRAMGSVWADANRDGWLDVFIPNGGGAASDAPGLFLANGPASDPFLRVTNGPVAEVRSFGAAAAWGDYDGDGAPDLMTVSGVAGPNPFYRNAGDGSLLLLSPGPIAAAGGPSAGAGTAWADFDNDGDLDLLLTAGVGQDALYRNNGDGTFTLVPGVPAFTPGATVGVVWADFDNDGWLDLLLANRSGKPALFRGMGHDQLVRVESGSLPNQPEVSNGVAVADYNADGSLDVVMANWPGGVPALYENVGGTNRWLRVRLLGAVSNRQGIGAKVRVSATIRGSVVRQMRQVGGEDGWGTQEPVAHFGLGDAAVANEVRVEWPSGMVSVVTNELAGQTLTIEEAPHAPLVIVPPGGVFTNSVNVRIRSTLGGGEIRYTTDGSEPSASSPLYNGPFEVRSRLTVKSRVFVNGFPVTDVVSADFRPDPGLQVEPAGGRFTNLVLVTLSTRIPGALVRYTTNGAEPDATAAIYTEPIRFTSSVTLSARAFFNGFPVSEVVRAIYSRIFAHEGDGISGAWREKYFGAAFETDPRAAVGADPDADGSPNLQEYLTGTDPLDPLSGFDVGIRAVPEVRFQAVVGQRYRILRRDSVTGSSVVVVDGLVATEPITTFVDTSIRQSAGFYVVEPVR